MARNGLSETIYAPGLLRRHDSFERVGDYVIEYYTGGNLGAKVFKSRRRGTSTVVIVAADNGDVTILEAHEWESHQIGDAEVVCSARDTLATLSEFDTDIVIA